MFFCEVAKQSEAICVKSKQKILAQSPLNYTGGKFRLLDQILPKFPNNISTFYDIFCGGFNVGSNIKAGRAVGIDSNQQLIELLNFIKNTQNIENKLERIIAKYSLSNSAKFGYEYYGSNSVSGLGNYNKQGFKALKDDYNKDKSPLLFLVLIIFGFNNQIRFNSKGEFNLPVGKRDCNLKLKRKLEQFRKNIQDNSFICMDFRQFDLKKLSSNDFLYLDPPYLLGNANYNENGGWTKQDEIDLLGFLKRADAKGIKFALSNVLEHKGLRNDILLEWCLENSFNILYLSHSYSNSSYQTKYKNSQSKEVLISNY